MDRLGFDVPIFIGGKLKRVPEANPSSMPVDVTEELRALGAVVCASVDEMLTELSKSARERSLD
jgi:hypothetical protein